jgi:hypothetical protein
MNVGRIVTSVTIENALDLSKSLTCDALVDTGASLMVLPIGSHQAHGFEVIRKLQKGGAHR